MNQPKMSELDTFYGRQPSADDLQRMAQANRQAQINSIMAGAGMGDTGLMGGQSLDELVSENHKEQQRLSFGQQMGGIGNGQHGSLRRVSMMEFGSGQRNGLEGYPFHTAPAVSGVASMPNGSTLAKQRMESQREALRRQSADNLGLETHFEGMGGTLGDLTQSPIFQQHMDADALDLGPDGSFMRDVQMGMDYGNSLDSDVSPVGNDMSMFSQTNFSMPSGPSMQQQSGMQMPPRGQDAGTDVPGAEQAMLKKLPQMNMGDTIMDAGYDPPPMGPPSARPDGLSQAAPSTNAANTAAQSATARAMTSNSRSDAFNAGFSSVPHTFSTGTALPNQTAHSGLPSYMNAYSQSGFDMLGVLMRIAARPKPQINIGAVDMSCAFVVCDVQSHDIPIVYCSEMFERLTGYTRHEILGRNCRFLQAPDGKVQSGLKRKYVDDMSVFQVKKAVSQVQEAQISLINYRKGGQPFMNLLTMIPIAWDTEDKKYYVGFQVDLVEQPASITNKNPGKNQSPRFFAVY